MKNTRARLKSSGSEGPVSEGEAIIQFFSLTCAAEIFAWDGETLPTQNDWIVDKVNAPDKNLVSLYYVDISFRCNYIAERDLKTGTVQIRSEKDYDRISRYYDLSAYFDCDSFTKSHLYDIMLKPRLISCLECEECLSCVTRGWPINKR